MSITSSSVVLFFAALYVLLASCGRCADASDGAPPTTQAALCLAPTTKPEFFLELHGKVPVAFRHYLSAPRGENPVEATVYPGVGKDFAQCAADALQRSLLPSDDAIIKSVRLFPATRDRKYDLAVLAYRIGNRLFWIAQTGGLGGEVCFIAHRTEPGQLETEVAAKSAFDFETVAMFKASLVREIPPLRIEKVDGAYVGLLIREEGKVNRLSYLQFLVTRTEIGYLWKKDSFSDRRLAHIPLRNEWFTWVRDLTNEAGGTR